MGSRMIGGGQNPSPLVSTSSLMLSDTAIDAQIHGVVFFTPLDMKSMKFVIPFRFIS